MGPNVTESSVCKFYCRFCSKKVLSESFLKNIVQKRGKKIEFRKEAFDPTVTRWKETVSNRLFHLFGTNKDNKVHSFVSGWHLHEIFVSFRVVSSSPFLSLISYHFIKILSTYAHLRRSLR